MSVLDVNDAVAPARPAPSPAGALKHLLVVMDTSAAAHTALRRAQVLATQHRASLTLLHVVPESRLRLPLRAGVAERVAAARTTLERNAARLSTEHGLAVRAVVETGDAFEHLQALAPQTDLLVLGVRRRNPLRDLFLRTPTERVLRTYPRPVLLTKAEAIGPYRELLVPVDFSVQAEHTLRTACALAPLASVELLHVLGERRLALRATVRRRGQQRDPERDHAVQQLCELAAEASGRGVRLTVQRGDASAHSLAQQQAHGSDLIVIGKDGDASFGPYLLGRVARRIVATAPCDVLVVPGAGVKALAG